MLIKPKYRKEESSIYKCDKCNKLLEKGKDKIYSIYEKEAEEKSPIKKLDLCEKDYKKIKESVKRWLEK